MLKYVLMGHPSNNIHGNIGICGGNNFYVKALNHKLFEGNMVENSFHYSIKSWLQNGCRTSSWFGYPTSPIEVSPTHVFFHEGSICCIFGHLTTP
jgi:hypothetical protein